MNTRARLEELIEQHILLLDTSMGAFLYARDPKEEDYCGTIHAGRNNGAKPR